MDAAESKLTKAVRDIQNNLVRKLLLYPTRAVKVTDLSEHLARIMVVQHGRAYNTWNQDVLVLDSISPLERALQKITSLDLAELEKLYNIRAFEALKTAEDYLNDELRKFIAGLTSRGVLLAQAKTELRKKMRGLGMHPLANYRLEAIIRTQMQFAYNAGKWLAEQSPGVQDILWGYVYNTVQDNRVRELHAAMHNITLPKDHPFWLINYPPNGFNCRCVAVPTFDKRKLILPPAGLQADEGFRWNPGVVLSEPQFAKITTDVRQGKISKAQRAINKLTKIGAPTQGLQRAVNAKKKAAMKPVFKTVKQLEGISVPEAATLLLTHGIVLLAIVTYTVNKLLGDKEKKQNKKSQNKYRVKYPDGEEEVISGEEIKSILSGIE